MRKEIRTIVHDEELQIEACHFEGMAQPFPSHFHEYYVIGFVEEGERILSCKGKKYPISRGSVVVFRPGDSHSCVQSNGGTLDYRSFHIGRERMQELTWDVTGRREIPEFSANVIFDGEIAWYLGTLHKMVMEGGKGFGKEEGLLLLMSALIRKHGQLLASIMPECREEIKLASRFMEEHYGERISLEQICRHVGLSKSTLLRAFIKEKGITPYRYLENVRINEAKKLLEQGETPALAAAQTGFSDQSHFTGYFNSFMGLTPGVYREIFCQKERDT